MQLNIFDITLPGKTWNPVTGCTKLSEGCKNCYAERIAKRLKRDGVKKYRNGFKPTLHPCELEKPLKWKKPKVIFVASMGDIFHEDIPDNFILKVFKTMNKAHWHQFRVLTKRAERMRELSSNINWTRNIWMGVSVEMRKYLYRMEILKEVPAYIKFVNFAPLLEDIGNIDLSGIDWVVVGGESGPNFRKLDPSWVRNIKDQCKSQNVPFYFSQWGGLNRKTTGNILDGKIYNELPVNKIIQCI